MSKTACWGTNSSFDCAWVRFGYGSRYDMIRDYPKGWWLSLDAIKVLVKYDLPFIPDNHIHMEWIPKLLETNWWYKDLLITEKYDLKNKHFFRIKEDGGFYYDYETWNELPICLQMRMTPIRIDHPDRESWFAEIKEYSGLFMKQFPDYRETIYYNNDEQSCETNIPSLESIRKINYSDWQIISRINFMSEQAIRNMKPDKDTLPYISDEELKGLVF